MKPDTQPARARLRTLLAYAEAVGVVASVPLTQHYYMNLRQARAKARAAAKALGETLGEPFTDVELDLLQDPYRSDP